MRQNNGCSAGTYATNEAHQGLMATAEQMIQEGKHEIAVVLAQMACEIFAEQVISAILKKKNLSYLEDALDDLLPSHNLANEKIRKFYVALTQDQIHHTFFWHDYKNLVSLRNRAVHGGGKVSRDQASVSIRAANHLIEHLSRSLDSQLT